MKFFWSITSSCKVCAYDMHECHYIVSNFCTKFPKSIHNYTFTLILVHPLDWNKFASFEQIRLQNGCISSNIQFILRCNQNEHATVYVVAKLYQKPMPCAKLYHIQVKCTKHSVFSFYYARKAAVSRWCIGLTRSRPTRITGSGRPPASMSHCDSCTCP